MGKGPLGANESPEWSQGQGKGKRSTWAKGQEDSTRTVFWDYFIDSRTLHYRSWPACHARYALIIGSRQDFALHGGKKRKRDPIASMNKLGLSVWMLRCKVSATAPYASDAPSVGDCRLFCILIVLMAIADRQCMPVLLR